MFSFLFYHFKLLLTVHILLLSSYGTKVWSLQPALFSTFFSFTPWIKIYFQIRENCLDLVVFRRWDFQNFYTVRYHFRSGSIAFLLLVCMLILWKVVFFYLKMCPKRLASYVFSHTCHFCILSSLPSPPHPDWYLFHVCVGLFGL